MKKSIRVISLLLALLMLGGVMASAADEAEEFNQALLDETIRINHEMGLTHVSTGMVEVHLKSNVTVRSEYEKLFPGIDAVKIIQMAPTAYDYGMLERQILLLTFADKTEDDIWGIIEILKVNPNVYYAAPVFIDTNAGASSLTSMPGDVNADGKVDNRDLIMVARFLVGLVYFNAEKVVRANFNGDNEINNADLISIARYVVSSTN